MNMAQSALISKTYDIDDADLVLDGENKKYILRVRDLPEDEKPREKLLRHGPSFLSLGELLAVVLSVGTRKEGILQMSSRLLKEYGEKTIIEEKNPRKIADALGIPLVKSCQLVACFELGRRFFRTPSGRPEFVRTSKQAYSYLKNMGDLSKEHLRGIYLNSHYRVVHDETISIGTLTSSVVHPREVFKPALEHAASAVILAHNHPSGILSPSPEDIAITRQIVEAGKILGISVLDHIVIAKNRFQSIAVNYD